MANDLKDKPDSDNPIQKKQDDKYKDQSAVDKEFDSLTSSKHYQQDGKPGDKSKPVDLDSAEKNATDDEKISDDGFYAPNTKPSKSKLWSSSDRGKGILRYKRRLISGGILLGVAGILLVVMMSFVTPALELFHIKEVLTQRVGDVQSLVVKSRTGKLYSRAFFFNDNGFDGYKSRGSVFSIYENYKTNNLLDDIRAADPSFDINYNQRTGRVNSVSWTDSNGDFQSVGSADEFASMWEKRGGLREAIDAKYPDRSAFWRSRDAKKLYARAGLSFTLSNWIENSRLGKAVDDLAVKLGRTFTPSERIVAKMRYAAFGDIFDNYVPGKLRITPGDIDETTTDADRVAQTASNDVAEDIGDGIVQEGDAIRETALNDPTYRPPQAASAPGARGFIGDLVSGDAKQISQKIANASTKAAIVGSIVDVSDKACRVKYLLDIVEVGARTTRIDDLVKNFTFFASTADAGKAGDLSSETVQGLATRVHAVDEAGDGFYAGGGWGNGIVDPDNINKYSSGGGSVEWLANANDFINSGGVLTDACGVVTNPLFQIAAGVAEAGVTFGPCILSGGLLCGFSAAKVGASVAVAAIKEAAFQVFMAVARPILVRMTAGLVVDYLEVGPEMSDALVSGATSWFGRRSSSAGMRPLSTKLFADLEADAKIENRHYFAQQSFYDKYLNPSNTESLMFASLIKLPNNFTSSVAAIKSSLLNFNPVKLLGTTFFNATSGTALAAIGVNDASDQCTDKAITDLDIATDPFCNPYYGEDLTALDTIDPLENTEWMIDNGYISPNVSADGDIVYCSDTPPAVREPGVVCSDEYKEYVNQCFLSSTTIRDEKNRVHEECFTNGPAPDTKYLRFRAFRLDRDLSVMITDSINKDFDY